MKEWNKPQLLSLGLENTFTDIETIGNGNGNGNGNDSNNMHFCHGINNWHSTEDCTHNHGGGSCKDPSHKWSEAHKSSCCCIGQS